MIPKNYYNDDDDTNSSYIRTTLTGSSPINSNSIYNSLDLELIYVTIELNWIHDSDTILIYDKSTIQNLTNRKLIIGFQRNTPTRPKSDKMKILGSDEY